MHLFLERITQNEKYVINVLNKRLKQKKLDLGPAFNCDDNYPNRRCESRSYNPDIYKNITQIKKYVINVVPALERILK